MRIVLLLMLSIYSIVTYAEAMEDGYFEWSLVNDKLFRTDRNYTGGGVIAWSPKGSPLEFRSGVELYTSETIATITQPEGEHPYAAYLYVGALYNLKLTERVSIVAGGDVGSVGPRVGGEGIQNNLHFYLNKPLVKGWANQIFDQWVYTLRLKPQFVFPMLGSRSMGLRTKLFTRLEMGNYRSSLGLGVEFLLGYNVPNFESYGLTDFSMYLFSRFEVQHVFHSVVLEGNSRVENGQKVHSYGVDLIHDITLMNLGVKVDFNLFFINVETVTVSRQFKTQKAAQDNYALISIGFHY